MRILTLSDKVEPVLYGPYIRERVGKVDLILACGDLPYYYLEYIVGLLDVPLFFVHGNHDKPVKRLADEQLVDEPQGLNWAEDLHERSIYHRGLLVAGLEGCRMYNPHAPYQYTDADVRRQGMRLGARLLFNRVRYGRYLDILITHAPPRGIHDGTDLAHIGFDGYLEVVRRYRPLLMIHGHTHVYNRNDVTETDHCETRVINTYGYRVLELSQRPEPDGWTLVSSSR